MSIIYQPSGPRYQHGDRVELTTVPPSYAQYAVTEGETGTVRFTDSLGTVHIIWDNGARVGIIMELWNIIRKIGDAR